MPGLRSHPLLRWNAFPAGTYIDPSNQWFAATFHQSLNDAINHQTLTFPDLSQDDRDTIELLVLGAWLDAAIPAGNG